MLFRKTICVFLPASFLLSSALWCQPALGQDGKILGGLLRELLESQVRRREEKQARQPLVIPGHQHVAPKIASTNLQTARGYCDSFATESKRLVRTLRQDARSVPGVRPCIDEMMRLQTRTEMMSRRFSLPLEGSVIVEDVRELDREWRAAAYRLNQLRGLPESCRKSIVRLESLNTQCCKLFDVGPQLNRHEIERFAHALAAEIHHLEGDVEHELRSKRARQLLTQLRRTETQAQLFGESVAAGEPYDVLVAEFKQFNENWSTIVRSLDASNNRHVARTMEQVNDLTRALHEQLWLPVGVDLTHIEHIASVTEQRIKSLNDSFSLSMLTELADGPAILTSAQKLNEELTHICSCVAERGSEQQIATHWVELDSAWKEFSHYTDPIDSQNIRRLRAEVTANIEAMRHGLGIQLAFDRRAVIRYAAELEGITEQAQRRVGMWQRRPGANVDATLIRAAKTLIRDCRHLHEECAGSASREHLARDCEKLARDWSKLRPQLRRCETVDQQALVRISDEATARLIRLQTVLAVN